MSHEQNNAAIDIDTLFADGLGHHQSGRLVEAEAIYRQILMRTPYHAPSLHLLGLLAHQVGQSKMAADLIGQAITQDNQTAVYHSNLGVVLKRLGKLDAAIDAYRQALVLDPGLADAHNNLGVALLAGNKPDAAASAFQQALSVKPDYAEAYNNLGNAWHAMRMAVQAVTAYRQALAIKPGFVTAYKNLAVVLLESGEATESLAVCDQAIKIDPGFAEAHSNRGNALKGLGNLKAAVAAYQEALHLDPNYAEAYVNLGSAYQDLNNLPDAIACYRRGLSLDPNHLEGLNNLASALRERGELAEAVTVYEQALSHKPDAAQTRSNLIFALAGQDRLSADEYLALARGWETACLPDHDRKQAKLRAVAKRDRVSDRLRIGYISGDFNRHVISCFIEPVLALHDRRRVEVFAYPTTLRRDEVTARIEASVEHWTPIVGMSDEEARQQIETDRIDVLLDLSGHTGGNRLGVFARRAAPVQAHYLGYCASTGLTEMDYWIADDILAPPASDTEFSETLFRLPRLSVAYGGSADAPVPTWRPRSDGIVRVGSFNRIDKISPACIALWARVLKVLPEAHLLIKIKLLGDASLRKRLLADFAGHGVDESRIELPDRSTTPDWASHMAYYDQLDVALDPIGGPSGCTTTCDALWMGVPVVAMEGKHTATRMTTALLHAFNRPEWVARNEDEYIAKTVALGRDSSLRQDLRALQRAQMAAGPLCDSASLTVALENAYAHMSNKPIGSISSTEA